MLIERVFFKHEPLGVWLDSNQDPADLADAINRFALIAVNFPKFTDGRGYSIAALLRSRYGFKGELRAIGDVLRDLGCFIHASTHHCSMPPKGRAKRSLRQ